MALTTKIWKVRQKNVTFEIDAYKAVCCKMYGQIHVFGLGSGYSHSTITPEVADRFYEFISDTPMTYAEVLKIYSKISLAINPQELRSVYRK